MIKKIIKYTLVFILLLSSYIILLTVVNLIPSSKLEKNIEKSAVLLKKQDEIPVINLGYNEESIFNFSDALMLNMAYSVDSNHPFESMMLSRKDYISGITEKEDITPSIKIGADSRFIDEKTGDVSHTKELYQLVNYKDIKESHEYARYWHGYMILLRPLLLVFNISQIRLLFSIILIVFSLILIYSIYKKIDLITSIIFLLGLFGCSIFIVGQSLSEIPVFLVALITSIIILKKKDIDKYIGIILFINGSIIGCTDLFTTPLISLLLPLTLYFLVSKKKSNKDSLKKYLLLCVLWGIGYIVTWVSKWVLLDLIYNRGVIKQSLYQAQVRSIKETIPYYKALARVISYYSRTNLIITFLIPALSMYIYARVNKKKVNKKDSICLLPFIINAIIPFIWFFIIRNHSILHPFFSYKLMMIFIINILLIFGYKFKILK